MGAAQVMAASPGAAKRRRVVGIWKGTIVASLFVSAHHITSHGHPASRPSGGGSESPASNDPRRGRVRARSGPGSVLSVKVTAEAARRFLVEAARHVISGSTYSPRRRPRSGTSPFLLSEGPLAGSRSGLTPDHRTVLRDSHPAPPAPFGGKLNSRNRSIADPVC